MRLLSIVLIFSSIVAMPGIAKATFSLSVTPYEGGHDLRYTDVTPVSSRINKELSVSINSDIAKQYRIAQQLLEPISTVQGARIPQNNLVVYGIRGTNRYGTLSVEQEISVSSGRQIIYTSNQTGTADSFTLVFGLIPWQDMEPGSYRGRISFTLEPIDSTQSSATVILNIFAEVKVGSTIEIKTADETKNIVLRSDRDEAKSADITVNIQGGFGRQFRIIQVVTEQPVSPEGKVLDWEAVNFAAKDAQKGIAVSEPTSISSRQQILYTSSLRGEADTFTVTYSLGDLTKQKAGRYRANIKYLFEGAGEAPVSLIDSLSLEVENPIVFDLVLTPEIGGAIQFRDARPLQPPKKSELTVEIKSNINKKYQVSQKVTSNLTSKEGYIIPEEYFTVRTESLDTSTKGIHKFPEKAPVRNGDTVLFISDNNGSADKFKVIYELSIPVDYRAGDYSTSIAYSLSEI